MNFLSRILGAAVVAVAGCAMSGFAGAVTLDFTDGPHYTQVGDFYHADYGLTFENARFFSSGGKGTIISWTDGVHPMESSPIVALFDAPLLNATVYAGDVGKNGVKVVAYDSLVGGNIVDMQETILQTDADVELNLAGGGIRRLEFFQFDLDPADGILWDNFAFEFDDVAEDPQSVPAPAIAVVLGVGAVLAYARKRIS